VRDLIATLYGNLRAEAGVLFHASCLPQVDHPHLAQNHGQLSNPEAALTL
jgi:hypothetical protein